jgi:hypothetical protein
MVKAFYNTTGETGTTLATYGLIAQEQQRTIYDFIKSHSHLRFSREDLRPLFPASTPVTSIVRALCNLRDMGVIMVVGKRMGEFKRPIFEYQYCEPEGVNAYAETDSQIQNGNGVQEIHEAKSPEPL